MTNTMAEQAWAAGEWSSAAMEVIEGVAPQATRQSPQLEGESWAAGEWSSAAFDVVDDGVVLPMLGGSPLRMMARMPARRATHATAQLPTPRRGTSHRMSMLARTDDDRAAAGEWAFIAEPRS